MVSTLLRSTELDSHEGQGAETVIHDLERQQQERLVSGDDGVIRMAIAFFVQSAACGVNFVWRGR